MKAIVSIGKTIPIMLSLAALLISSVVLSQNLIDDITLKNWGFRNLEQQYYDLQLCGFPQNAKIATKSIKALLPEKNSDVYPRFTLVREEYANTDLAANRIKELHHHKFKNSLQSKSCSLRKYQQQDRFVLLIHTDALRFADQLDILLSQLLEHSNNMSQLTDARYKRFLCDARTQNLYEEIMRPQPPDVPANHLAYLNQKLNELKRQLYFRDTLLTMIKDHGLDEAEPPNKIAEMLKDCANHITDTDYAKNLLDIMDQYTALNAKELEADIQRLEQQLNDYTPAEPIPTPKKRD